MQIRKSKLFVSLVIVGLSCVMSCNSQSLSVAEKLSTRNYPSVFQAWNNADNLTNESQITTIARHDLYFTGASALKLVWNNQFEGLSTGFTEASINQAKTYKQQLEALNPNIITIVEIRYRDAHSSYLPSNSNWWMRDGAGNYVYGWEEGGFIRMELRDTNYQNRVAEQAAAVLNSGAVDGIMLDWWTESEYWDARLAILMKIRNSIGDKGLIILNSNQNQTPKSAAYANGLFMECYDSPDATNQKWQKYQSTLEWAEQNLKEPRINCLETWFKTSRNDLNRMRATTTLALTRSNGFCLFSDPNTLPTPDHLHNWYPFYNAPLGKPIEMGFKRTDNAWQRNYTNGVAIYNPIGNSVITVTFNEDYRSEATGNIAKSHQVNSFDGDIFIKKGTGTFQKPTNKGFSIYQNPKIKNVRISADRPISNVAIFKSSGQKCISSNYSNVRSINIDTSTFTEGLYFVQVSTKTEAFNFKTRF